MAENAIRNQPSLYERDFHEWTRRQARAIAERRVADVDWANVAEEVESVGRSERRALKSYLVTILAHLAKWEHQPEKRTYGRQDSISQGRLHIAGIIEASPSLKQLPGESLDWCWTHARRKAALDMRRETGTLPEACPYTAAEALDDAFMPGPGWNDDDLIDA